MAQSDIVFSRTTKKFGGRPSKGKGKGNRYFISIQLWLDFLAVAFIAIIVVNKYFEVF
ncbi:MAG: hypothetical protein GF401_20850 [Chitinivibrionales bacterium]|nr:hypothetical protein [Chitinivibrionales bacterium]